MRNAAYWIEKLRLARHPEGGYYRETYRCEREIEGRACSTAMYFLLPANEVAKFHRLRSDEVWHFYDGSELTIHIISQRGDYRTEVIGPASFQAVVPANSWFGTTVDADYTLAGCTVAPGFDFRDFEMGQRIELLRQFPQHRPVIERLTP